MPWPWISGFILWGVMLGLAAYAVKRRTLARSFGPAHRWRTWHVYGGMVFLPLLIWHGGLTVPPGTVDSWLWTLSVWVFLSGLLGVGVQKWIPRALAGGVSMEVVYERIPGVVDDLRREAEELAAAGPATLQEFYRDALAPTMAAPETRLTYFLDVTGGVGARTRQFEFVRKHTESEHEPLLADLERVYRTKLECDAHFTLQKALRWWMWLHLPPSVALTVLSFLHLYLVIRY